MNDGTRGRRRSLVKQESNHSSVKQPNFLCINYPGLESRSNVYYPVQLVDSPEKHRLLDLSRQRASREAHTITLRNRSMTHLFGITANRQNTLRVFDEVNSYTRLKQISQSRAIYLSLARKNRITDSEYVTLSDFLQTKPLCTHPPMAETLGSSDKMHAQCNVHECNSVLTPVSGDDDATHKATLITQLPPEKDISKSDIIIEESTREQILSEEALQLLSTKATVYSSDTGAAYTADPRESHSDYLTLDDLALGSSANGPNKKDIGIQKRQDSDRQRLLAKLKSACIPSNVKIKASIGVREMTLKPIQSIPSTSVTDSQIFDRSSHRSRSVASTTTYMNRLVQPLSEKDIYISKSGAAENAIRCSKASLHKFVTEDSSKMEDLVQFVPDNAAKMRRRSQESIAELSGLKGPRVVDVLDVLVWSRRSCIDK